MRALRPTKPVVADERKGVYRFPTLASARPASSLDWSTLLECAERAGIRHLGVAPVEPFASARAAFERWLGAGHHGEMSFLEGHSRSDPKALLPEARSMIVIAVPYGQSGDGETAIAQYAQGRDYHHVLRTQLLDLGESLAIAFGKPLLGRLCVDSAPLLEREAARRAGLGFMGKSTLAIVPGAGSYFMLGELLLDVELPESRPTQTHKSGCGQCTRCLEVCPTQAFVAPYVLDSRRCVSYLTIEFDGMIPFELRSKIGTRVFGCDLCQAVCPFNQTKHRPAAHPDLAPVERLSDPDLVSLLELGSAGYRRLVKRSALRRASRQQLQRNAAVALGNAKFASPSEREHAVRALSRQLEKHRSPVVRAHVAWALGRIGGERALGALCARLDAEPDPRVRSEIEYATRYRPSPSAGKLSSTSVA